MKFIDEFDTRARRIAAQYRRYLPFYCPKGCYPISHRIGPNDLGHCVGLIDNANDLDCIKFCIFTLGKKGKRLRQDGFHITPAEALALATSLTTTAIASLEHNSEYHKHHDAMTAMRESGDMGVH